MPDFDEIQRKIKETQPSKLRRMKTDEVVEYEQYFAGQSFGTSPRSQQCQQLCQAQLALIQNELQHRETFGIDTKALKWGRIAGVAAIVTVVVSVAALICSIYISKPQPSTPEPKLPPTSQQTQTPTNVLPEPAANSNSASASKTWERNLVKLRVLSQQSERNDSQSRMIFCVMLQAILIPA